MSGHFDEVLEQVGGWGWYQKRLWIMLTLIGEATIGQNMIIMIFAAAPPSKTCSAMHNNSLGEGVNLSSDCLTSNSCARVDYAEDILTIPRQFNLYCEKSILADVLSAVQMAGVLCGALFWGQMAELFGRKPVLMTIYFLTCSSGIGAAYSPTYGILALAMFLLGLCLGGFWCVNYVIVQEAVSPEHRLFVSCINGWPLTISLFSILTWQLPDWRYDLLVINITGFATLLFFFWVEESPRWLLQTGRGELFRATLTRIAAANGVQVPELPELVKLAAADGKARAKKYTYRHLFRNRRMTGQFAALAYSWFVTSCVAYALGFNTKNLPGNRFLNIFLMGMSAGIFNLFVPCINRCGIGRRLLHQVSISSATLCTAIVFLCYIADDSWGLSEYYRNILIIFFAILGSSCTGPVWVVVYLYSAEIFPTVVRNLGGGLCSVAGRIGGISAPLILMISTSWPPLPWLLFTLLMGSNLLVAIAGLPETRGVPLPDALPPKEPILNCCQLSGRKRSCDEDD